MNAPARRAAQIAALALALAAPAVLPAFSVTLLDYVGVSALAAIGLTLLTGVAGVVSFGQAAFVGVAAYATAWLTTNYALSAWLGLGLAVALTLAAAGAIGLITMRLKGHLLSLSTLAWGLAIAFSFGNIDGLGNFTGISGVPPIYLGALSLGPNGRLYYLILAFVVAALWLSANLLNSRVGRAFRALRGGGLLVESVGVDPYPARLTAFLLAALLAALSGWLYAHLERFVSPSSFGAAAGIEYLMMAMLGGAASPVGGLIGAALITIGKNGLQEYLPLIAAGASAQWEIVVFSALFIVFLQRAREGATSYLADLWPLTEAPPAPAPTLPRRRQPRAGEPLVTLDHVERRFGGLIAVSDLSFEVKAGEILGLIGPNGAGKSTAFNLITGALAPSAGAIHFRGESLTNKRQYAVARAGVARTFQHVRLRPRMSALDNVLIGGFGRLSSGIVRAALRLDRAEEASARHEAQILLQRVGLAARAFDAAGGLSLGEQRLLEIARALMTDPILLVLDEPAAGLRRAEKQALAMLLRELRGEGLTILIVEHDMNFVMTLVDRIVVMDFGVKLSEGAPEAVRADERVRQAYLGAAI